MNYYQIRHGKFRIPFPTSKSLVILGFLFAQVGVKLNTVIWSLGTECTFKLANHHVLVHVWVM